MVRKDRLGDPLNRIQPKKGKERGEKKKKKRSSGGIDKVFFLSCSDKRNPGHLSSLSRPVASSGPKSSSLSLEPVYTTLRRGGRVYQVGGGGGGGGDQNLCIRRKEADSLVRVKRGSGEGWPEKCRLNGSGSSLRRAAFGKKSRSSMDQGESTERGDDTTRG